MTDLTKVLSSRELAAIAPEIFLPGELDGAKLLTVIAAYEPFVLKRTQHIDGGLKQLDKIALDSESAADALKLFEARAALEDMRNETPVALLTLMTHSSYPDACLGLYDLIRYMDPDIKTYVRVIGMCLGPSTAVLTAVPPERRYATANSTFSVDIGFHQPGFHVPTLPAPDTIAYRLMECYYQGTAMSRKQIVNMPPAPFGIDKALEYGLVENVVGRT